MIKRAFTEHPESVGETYFEHLAHASGSEAAGDLVRSETRALFDGHR